jgi:hypothetical protein
VKRERPAAVLVLAVLTVVVGALGVVAGGAGLALSLGSTAAPRTPPPLPPGATNAAVQIDELTYLRTKVPGYRVFETARPVTVMALAAVLLAAGIGLFEMHAWARAVAVAAAGSALLLLVLAMLYEVGFVLPSLEDWRMEGYRYNYYLQSGPTPAPPPALNLAPVVLLTGSLLFVVYAVVALVVLFLPVVSAAFASRRAPADPA